VTDIRPCIVASMDISTRLDKAMRAAGFESQSGLARASGVPQPTINRILKGGGKRGPETETLKKLAVACNISFAWLNEGRGPMDLVDQPELADPMRLTCETAQELRLLTAYRLANDAIRSGFDSVANDVLNKRNDMPLRKAQR